VDAKAAGSDKYRSPSVCLALSLAPLYRKRSCDRQAGDDRSLAPCWVSGLLALAIAQPRSQASQAEEIERTPLGRVAEAVDPANVICFLASADADFVTRLTIDVTGGV
jgi:NAD(P)-dependent dehydrogenase (short-subunit alcohol dehydrogenase family)